MSKSLKSKDYYIDYFVGKLINIHYVRCAVCGRKFEQLTNTHCKLHGISISDYRKCFPKAKIHTKTSEMKSKYLHGKISFNTYKWFLWKYGLKDIEFPKLNPNAVPRYKPIRKYICFSQSDNLIKNPTSKPEKVEFSKDGFVSKIQSDISLTPKVTYSLRRKPEPIPLKNSTKPQIPHSKKKCVPKGPILIRKHEIKKNGKVRRCVKQVKKSLKKKPFRKPHFNNYACKVFDCVNCIANLDGRHGLNGGEYYVLNYYLDYYEPTLNIVCEWDEEHHYRRGKLRKQDYVRMHEIIHHLNCDFYRIRESTGELTRYTMESF